MSRISKKPLTIPVNIKFKLLENKISFIGKHGELSYVVDKSIDINVEKNTISISTSKKKNNAMLGMTSILLKNMVIGVDVGFEKKLKLVGVGYKAKIKEKLLELNLGFSHVVKYAPKKGIEIKCNSNTELTIFGINKQLVGQTAAEIRLLRKPEPYKGKGIRYFNEKVKIKDSKKNKVNWKVNNNFIKKLNRKNARKRRCRARISKQEICRLTVYRSCKNIYAQIFSSDKFFVLASASSLDKNIKDIVSGKDKTFKSKEIGKLIAKRAKVKGISRVAFDKSGYKYHGCIKAVAESAREHGLSF